MTAGTGLIQSLLRRPAVGGQRRHSSSVHSSSNWTRRLWLPIDPTLPSGADLFHMLRFLGDGSSYAWQSSSHVKFSCSIHPNLRAQFLGFDHLGLLPCKRLTFVSLRRSNALPDVACSIFGMRTVSVYQQCLRWLLKLVRSPLVWASFFFLGGIDLPFDWLSFSFAIALKSQLVFLERLPRLGCKQWGGAHATTFMEETVKGTWWCSPRTQAQPQNSQYGWHLIRTGRCCDLWLTYLIIWSNF